MLILIILLVLLLGGGFGYMGHANNWPGGGPGIGLGTVVVAILLIYWLLGVFPRH